MTRDRQAAIDRAIAAYRRLIQVRAQHTAAEMIADLVEWHKIYVDEKVDVTALFETAQRRIEVQEAGRESQARSTIVTPEEAPTIARRERVTLDRIMEQQRAAMREAPRVMFTQADEPVEWAPMPGPMAEEVTLDEPLDDPEF